MSHARRERWVAVLLWALLSSLPAVAVDTCSFAVEMEGDPLGDAPRLLYADWLEEKGIADRAEIIRLQIERKGLEGKANPSQRVVARIARMKERELELKNARLAEWLPGVKDAEFVRGLAESIQVEAESLDQLRKLPAWETIGIRSIKIVFDSPDRTAPERRFVPGALKRFAQSPLLAQVEQLEFECAALSSGLHAAYLPTEVYKLLSGLKAPRLTHLSLSGVGESHLELATTMPLLTHLSLDRVNNFALVDSMPAWRSRLRSLQFDDAVLEQDYPAALHEPIDVGFVRDFPALEELRLPYNCGGDLLLALAQEPELLPGLRLLHLELAVYRANPRLNAVLAERGVMTRAYNMWLIANLGGANSPLSPISRRAELNRSAGCR